MPAELPPEPVTASAPMPAPTPGSMATPPPAPRAAVPQMVVVRGSPNALAWYPLGRKVPVSGQVCLPANARYVTFQRTDGGTVTFGGGGCNKVIAEPPQSEGRAGAGNGP
ncbi:hypothetical protein [Parerythrobacter lacustris]|uniref:Uncharacterized protein n=1 Tax=Parerythrobacter lacustris TaxID=2969984 RepID=A0ABT1XLC6_9SPHN|nr:hypothetical protein [Parerythrobacter lacustris]MCR2832377.1 hypothetical protein [Parerythrobacter lacustris]